jgi:hypothetical protein
MEVFSDEIPVCPVRRTIASRAYLNTTLLSGTDSGRLTPLNMALVLNYSQHY